MDQNIWSRKKAAFSFRFVSGHEVHNIVRSLNTNRPLGLFVTPAGALKDDAEYIVPHLTRLLNNCIDQCTFSKKTRKKIQRSMVQFL